MPSDPWQSGNGDPWGGWKGDSGDAPRDPWQSGAGDPWKSGGKGGAPQANGTGGAAADLKEFMAGDARRLRGQRPQQAPPAAAATSEPQFDEAELAELQNFLNSGSGGGGAGATRAAAAYSAAAPAVSPPLPPGFENGPGTAAAGSQQMNGAAVSRPPPQMNGAAPRPARGGLEGEAAAQVSVVQEDRTAPYLAVSSWQELGLPKEIMNGIDDIGFVKPSKIQEWALPIAMKGGNIIGQAQNGSGKTAAFALSMLCQCDVNERYPQALCVCPTRELAMQNAEVIGELGKFTGLELFKAVAQGDRPPKYVEAQIIVGTPGKIGDLAKRRTIELRWTKIFVVDEADNMIDEDHSMGPQVMQIRKAMSDSVQILLFSATWPDHVEMFANKMVPRANRIKVQKEDLTLDTIHQTYHLVSGSRDAKAKVLSDLYGALNIGQSIIFVNTRNNAFDLARMMKAEGHTVTVICGTQKTERQTESIEADERDRIMQEFRTGVTKVLISTDVLARGIDVPAVTLVVNYDMPTGYQTNGAVDYETYMHRIGRTGRFGLRGVAVNFIEGHQVHMITSIQNHYQCKITQLEGDIEQVEDLVKGLR